jgi:two-component system phosphate regulon response regulator PhoB
MNKLLLVEDDGDIRELIELHLKREGFEVDSVSSGEEALKKLGTVKYQFFVFDWMLPGLSGIDLIRKVRAQPEHKKVPVLMLTAKGEPRDVVIGLESGADDYVTKPFEPGILTARVRALLRRLQPEFEEAIQRTSSGTRSFSAGGLTLREDFHEVRCKGEKINLTPYEFKLLVALLENQGRVLTRDQLIASVQGQGVSVVDRAIDTHVFGLRKKLGACTDLIETVRGVGYRVRVDA